ncbi:gastrin-releasing peptide [Amphiprion ocellaris]|uniref:gastrin-releasing peptide n=1 Tax=Amphiprion ocellaris TaxID=80972 RepID=UPI000C317F23|nr:gastrin-releasing peptide [Amphiprion ocellaris]
MGGVCLCCSWTCRPVWPLFILLAAVTCVLHCSESPAAVAGKVYPRGNHWAVGHLMGKKSVESLPELQKANQDSDHLTPPQTARRLPELERYEHLMEALLHPKNQKQMKQPHTADRLLHSSWREEDREKYLREMSHLLLLDWKRQDDSS